MELSFEERRVLGVLVEKAFTTPDQYPLTLNYLVSASNQKSCRNPLTQFDEETVLDALDTLRQKGYASLVQTAGGRTDRYRHRIRDALELSAKECAVFAELLLRGPQSDGELRQNAKRMTAFESLDDLHATLEGLGSRPESLVVRLGSAERRRGARYAHTAYAAAELERLQSAEAAAPSSHAAPRSRAQAVAQAVDEATNLRVEALEQAVARLEERLRALEQSLGISHPEGVTEGDGL